MQRRHSQTVAAVGVLAAALVGALGPQFLKRVAAQPPATAPGIVPGQQPPRGNNNSRPNFGSDNKRYQPLPPKPAAGKNAPLSGALNLAMGMPAPAGKEQKAYLLERPQHAMSYNDSTHTPNWVAWHLSREAIVRNGPTRRQEFFTPDPKLPKAFVPVQHQDYNLGRDGFDRGHMVPAADRSLSDDDNKTTFLTTNIVPQAPNNNQLGWERFERHCRELAKDGWELFIVAGPWGRGGEGIQGRRETQGRAQVVVPAKTWKVVLMAPPGVVDPAKVDAKTCRTIAIIMPNDQSVVEDWTKYEVDVADVEKLTGFKFFPKVPADAAAALKGTAGRKPAPQKKAPAKALKGGISP